MIGGDSRRPRQTIEAIPDFNPEATMLESWPGQILILSSVDGQVSYPRLDDLRQRYERARVHVFDKGGHPTILLFPDEVTAVLRDWLADVFTPASGGDHQSPSLMLG